MEKALSELYYDPSGAGSFGGAERLYQRARAAQIDGVTRDKVRQFLAGQFAYTLHRPARRHFKRNPIYASGIDRQWQADLADMQTLADENDRARYMLTVVDVFSKYAWAVPIVRKEAQTVTDAFAEVLRQAKPRCPDRLQTDKGTEFFNAPFGRLMKRHGIAHFASQSDQKAACVERFNRTIKSRLYTYMTAKATNRWVDVLQDMMHSYNHSRHRVIGMAPADVRKSDEDRLWVRLYGDGDTIRKRIERVPDDTLVRVNRWKGSFEKGYMKNWSQEHFKVAGQTADAKRPVYKLKDDAGEEVKGVWYPEEIQPITANEYRIERVIKRRRGANGKEEQFVKWLGWPEKFNSWVEEAATYDVGAN